MSLDSLDYYTEQEMESFDRMVSHDRLDRPPTKAIDSQRVTIEALPEQSPVGAFYRERVQPAEATTDPLQALYARLFFEFEGKLEDCLNDRRSVPEAINQAEKRLLDEVRQLFPAHGDTGPYAGFVRDAADAFRGYHTTLVISGDHVPGRVLPHFDGTT
ncbi:MAG: hypothetical protein WD603_02580 [Patescibacteria group bacterium]